MNNCMECGKPFAAQNARHACCSTECALKWRRRNQTPQRVSIAFTCAKCGRAVVTEPERGDRRSRFCSMECEKKYWRHPPKEGKEVRNYTCAEVYMAYERRTNKHF